MGCGGYTPAFWSLCAAAFVAFILAVVGHVTAVPDSSNQGEIPLWYQIEACQNSTGTIRTTPTGEVSLCAKHVTSCPTVWNMYVSRAAPEILGIACPTGVVEEQTELRITLEPDDGFVGGVPYNPIFVLPTGASALISFKVEDGEGGTLLPTTNAELGPGTTYPWRELGENRGEVSSGAAVTEAAVECSTVYRCASACTYKNDGACDDGGPGSLRGPNDAVCPRGTDCDDCVTPICTGAAGEAPIGRRLAATESDPDARSAPMQQESPPGAQVEGAAEAAAEVPAPGSRRLLKGGSSGGGFSSGSRSSYSGSYSGSRGYSTSGRTSAYSSGYSRSSSPTSYSRSYSSYRPGGYYGGSSYGSRGYYGGGRSYGYRYGYGGYGRSHSIYIVGPYYYGCYSCNRNRNCNSCQAAAPLLALALTLILTLTLTLTLNQALGSSLGLAGSGQLAWRKRGWPAKGPCSPHALSPFHDTHERLARRYPVTVDLGCHGTRYVRYARGWYVYDVRTVAHQLPCASGTYATQEAGTRSLYGGSGTYGSAQPSTSSTRSPTRSRPSSAAGPRSAVIRFTSPKPEEVNLATTPNPEAPRLATTRRSGSTSARPSIPPSGVPEATAARSACRSAMRTLRLPAALLAVRGATTSAGTMTARRGSGVKDGTFSFRTSLCCWEYRVMVQRLP